MKTIRFYWLSPIPLLILLTIYSYPTYPTAHRTAHQHFWATASKESSDGETGLAYSMMLRSHKGEPTGPDIAKAPPTANQAPHLTTSEATVHTDPPNWYSHRGGYVLSHDYWEQLTAGSMNLLTLQCWASRLNMSVVEPFVKRSDLYSPTGDKEVKDLLHFSDVYNLDYWNAQSGKANYSSLAPWLQFVERAPRNLITVDLHYGDPAAVPKGDLHTQKCKSSQSWNNLVRFLESKHFTVIRRICINFQYRGELGESNFNEEVFTDNKPRDSTVLFGQWRGLHNNRMYKTRSGCEKRAKIETAPSKRVFLDAQKYTERYLKTHNYVSIFLRMEKAVTIMRQQQRGTVTSCFHETLDYWRSVVSATGFSTTFLSTDIGRLGSKSFLTRKSGLDGPFSDFFKTIYGSTLTIREWEATFENISGTSQSGYIAMLQKAIAAHAKCVVFVGGGSFQRTALELYKKTHAQQDWCIYFVRNCTSMKSYEGNLPPMPYNHPSAE